MKISVLVAAYNRVPYLKECLESANNQTLSRDKYEIIVVDDGSNDDMSEIEHLCDMYYRLPENKGISHARNLAMELARGEYYFVLDSDDVLEPECLEKELEFIESNGADMVFCDLPFINSAGDFMGDSFPGCEQTIDELLQAKLIPHPSSLIRKSSLLGAKYDERFSSAVDFDFLLDFMLKKDQVIKKLELPLYRYRIHGNQETFKQRQSENALKIKEKYANNGYSSAQ